MVNMKKTLFTVNQAWEVFGGTISRTFLYKMMRTGQIPCVQIGHRKLISGAWVEKILKEAEKMEV